MGPSVAEGAVDPKKLRKSVVAAIDELKTELETSHDNLAAQAPHHVLSSDSIMTHKFSSSQTLRVRFETDVNGRAVAFSKIAQAY